MTETTPTTAAAIGHNRPPAYDEEAVAALLAEAERIADAAGEWAKAKIETETKAGELKDFLDAARKRLKEIDKRRTEDKKPHLEAGNAVDAAYKRITDVIERAGTLAKAPLEAYLKEQQKIAEERRRAEQEAARKAAEEAERERQIAERNANAAAMVEAEEKAAQAAAAQKAAEAERKLKVSSATGTGSKSTSLRTVRFARITNINQAMLHYRGHPDLIDCITRLANADVRAAKGADVTIPGIEIIEEQKL